MKILQKQSVTLTVINNVLNKKTQQMLSTFRRGNISIHIPMTKTDKNSVTRAAVLFCHRREGIEGFGEHVTVSANERAVMPSCDQSEARKLVTTDACYF